MRIWSTVQLVLAATVLLTGARPTSGQTVQNAVASPSMGLLETYRLPVVTASIGASSFVSSHLQGMQPTVSARVFLGRHIAVEGEILRGSGGWDYSSGPREIRGPNGFVGYSLANINRGTEEASLGGINLVYSTDPRRVTLSIGGGMLFGRRQTSFTYGDEGCPGASVAYCSPVRHVDHSSGERAFQSTTAVDLTIAGPLHAYASLNLSTTNLAWLRSAAGLRIVAATRPAIDTDRRTEPELVATVSRDAAIGKTVRVTLANGERITRRLISLTDDGVTLRSGAGEQRLTLDQVRSVETAAHSARNFAIGGAIGGFVFGLIACGGEADCAPAAAGAMVGGIAAGGGAAIGGLIDYANRRHHIVYAGTKPSVTVQPTLTRNGAALSISKRW